MEITLQEKITLTEMGWAKKSNVEIRKITLRLPESVYEQIKTAAKRKGISMNEEIIFCLSQQILE